MKTVRLSAPLEAKLDHVARATGQSASQIIRDAIDAHCDTLVESDLRTRLADVIGIVSGGEEHADLSQRTEEAFAEVMEEKRPRIMGLQLPRERLTK